MPLAMAPCNREMKVRKIAADERTGKHLMGLGISVGCTIMLLSSGEKGVIVAVREGRLCLDGNLARKILVA